MSSIDTNNKIRDDISSLRILSQENNTTIIVTDVNTKNSAPFVHIGPDHFRSAFEALKPQVLYLVILKFNLEHQIGLKLDTDSDDEDSTVLPNVPVTSTFRALTKRWKNKEGCDHSYLACFMANGVLHFTSYQDDWVTAFDEDADNIVEEWIRVEKDNAVSIRSVRKEEIRINAKILSEHPQFNASKSSREKRLYLTEQVFPHLDKHTHNDILDLADLMFWYRSSLPT